MAERQGGEGGERYGLWDMGYGQLCAGGESLRIYVALTAGEM